MDIEDIMQMGLSPEDITDDWDEGYHETRDGEMIKISLMENSHLKNCITFFGSKGYDITPFKEELEKRIK